MPVLLPPNEMLKGINSLPGIRVSKPVLHEWHSSSVEECLGITKTTDTRIVCAICIRQAVVPIPALFVRVRLHRRVPDSFLKLFKRVEKAGRIVVKKPGLEGDASEDQKTSKSSQWTIA